MNTTQHTLENVSRRFYDTFGRIPVSRAYAPGRLEVIGNHTDYNGGKVVGAAIDHGTAVAMRQRDDGRIRLISDACLEDSVLETSMDSYAYDGLPSWSTYPLGVIDEARLRQWVPSGAGLDMAIHSTLPIGAGLSSSAALELAVAGALVRLFFDPASAPGIETLIETAHRAENRFVGMPCGILDQTVAGMARQDHLVVIDAASGRVDHAELPQGVGFAVFRSHISHALLDTPYEERHRECRQALMGLERFVPGIRHLATVHEADLGAYAAVLDTRARLRATHVVHEQARVHAFLHALRCHDLPAAGNAMTTSHESSRSLFDNSIPELDVLAAAANQQEDVLGARLTGGGWGGAVIALVRDPFSSGQAEHICDAYEELFDVRPHWWRTAACHGLVHERVRA
jgi:galactokinase